MRNRRNLATMACGVAFAVLALAPADACTIFFAYDGKLALGGNSEEWKDPITYMWVRPGSDGNLGRIVFGFGNGFPQGGVNEKGLFFDGAAVSMLEIANPTDKPIAPADLFDRMLAECSTVGDALAMLNHYHVPWMSNAMLLIGDRDGRSVIWEGAKTLERPADAPFQSLTNFRQSQMTAQQAGCERKQEADRLMRTWADSKEALKPDVMLSVLRAVHRDSTRYSQVYDLTHGVIHLYVERDFDHPITIDVAQELRNGKRTARLSEMTAATLKPNDTKANP